MEKQIRFKKRFWEILPGACSLTLLALPVCLSFLWPVGVAYFIILFDTYWLVKALVMAGHLLAGLVHLKRGLLIDWLERCRKTNHLSAWARELRDQLLVSRGFDAAQLHEECQAVEELLRQPDRQIDWREIFHGVMFAVYRETEEVLEASLRALLASAYPRDRLIVILALEARAGEEGRRMAEKLRERFRRQFADFLLYVHPDDLPGELKGKAANITWAGEHFRSYLDLRKIPLKNVILSVFDADTVVHPQYLAYLTYQYVITPDRLRRSYQPIPLFNNNIWQVPAINRLVAFSSSFWQMIESTRPYRLVTFSSQAIPMQTLVEVGYWDKTVVNEDSRIFYQAYYHFGGNYKVVPLFIPVSMDAVLGNGFWATLKAQYLQKRRWAYGIEHFPYLMQNFFSQRAAISFWRRWIWVIRMLEGHISWATASLLIAAGGWMPILLNSDFRDTIVAFNLPILARNVLSLTWIGVFIAAWIGFQLLPKREKLARSKLLEYLAQWILVPVAGIFFGSLPALDAELRLMLGRYLGFRATEKVRKGLLGGEVLELATGQKTSK